jgi:hypothetical protein
LTLARLLSKVVFNVLEQGRIQPKWNTYQVLNSYFCCRFSRRRHHHSHHHSHHRHHSRQLSQQLTPNLQLPEEIELDQVPDSRHVIFPVTYEMGPIS